MILKMKYYSGRQVHNIITETIAGKTLADVLERFAKEPSADVQEIRRGHWIVHGEAPWLVVECSNCGAKWHHWSGERTNNYCGNCGAIMDKEEA